MRILNLHPRNEAKKSMPVDDMIHLKRFFPEPHGDFVRFHLLCLWPSSTFYSICSHNFTCWGCERNSNYNALIVIIWFIFCVIRYWHPIPCYPWAVVVLVMLMRPNFFSSLPTTYLSANARKGSGEVVW